MPETPTAKNETRRKGPREPQAPGRPRDPAVDQAILGTTFRLLAEHGYDAMSIEDVAVAAGVAKTTIYRRYAGKRELVVAALSSVARSLPPTPDTGDARRDLRAFVAQTLAAIMRDDFGVSMVGTLLVKERTEPALMKAFREAVFRPRMRIAADIARRGIERGQIRSDVDPDMVIELVSGSFLTRHLVGRPGDEAWLDDVLDTLWRGIATEDEGPGRPETRATGRIHQEDS